MCDHANREAAMVTIQRDDNGTPIVWCDPCLASLIEALNAGGIETVASCCGHNGNGSDGEQTDAPGWVMLRDGRTLTITPAPVPSEADPGTGERKCMNALPHRHPAECVTLTPATPDAGDGLSVGAVFSAARMIYENASPATGDVQALAREVCPCTDDPNGTHVPDLDAGCGWALALCHAVLASDWLASHDAATADRVRRETAAEIAAAIEADMPAWLSRHFARIAREAAHLGHVANAEVDLGWRPVVGSDPKRLWGKS